MSQVIVEMPFMDRADQMISLIKDMRESLSCSEEVRQSAGAIASAEALDEETLWSEWFNENIHDKNLYGSSRQDPGSSYLSWLSIRVADPFRLSGLAIKGLIDKLGADAGMRVALVLWHQEVSWAHRLRRSADVRIAVLSHLFVTAARGNPAREVSRVADYYPDASVIQGYAVAIEHGFTPEQIREGYGSEGFGPLFLRYAEGTLGQRVDSMTIDEMKVLAKHVSGLEERELRKFAKNRALRSLEGSPIITMTGVIAEAIRRGLDSNDLMSEWDRFVDAVRNDTFQIQAGTGRPYTEFMAWLRTESEPGAGVPSADCSAEMMGVLSGPRGWVSSLPDEYLSLGAADAAKFRAWSDAVVDKTVRPPRDLALDYGFFLVRQSFS